MMDDSLEYEVAREMWEERESRRPEHQRIRFEFVPDGEMAAMARAAIRAIRFHDSQKHGDAQWMKN